MLAASYVISCPLSVSTTTKKRFYLNLNQYRNAHHFTLAKAKVNFHEMMAPRVKHLPCFDTVNLIFTLFPGSEQLVDTSNVCSIVDKFFSDVLVKCKKIQDDNRKIVLSVVYRYGEIDRLNPRVEVTISPGEIAPGLVTVDQPKRENAMQITINQVEIEKAIESRIRSQIMVREGFRIDIDLKATRGPEGYQAVIDIVEEDSAPAVGSRSTGVSEVASEVKSSRTSAPASTGTPAKAERPKAVTKATPPKPAAEPKPEPEVAEAAPVAEAAQEPVAEPDAEAEAAPAVEAEPDMSAEADVASQPEPESDAAIAAEGAAPAARPSLFGNLGKPQND